MHGGGQRIWRGIGKWRESGGRGLGLSIRKRGATRGEILRRNRLSSMVAWRKDVDGVGKYCGVDHEYVSEI